MNEFINGIGYLTTIIVILQIILGGFLWWKGFLPVIWRFGNGLSKREVIILAKGDNEKSLVRLVLDSNLICEKNVSSITKIEDFGAMSDATLFVVNFHDWTKNEIEKILQNKKDSDALIVYAPQDKGLVDKNILTKINETRNTTLCNFRGRLLNDLTILMITTKYE